MSDSANAMTERSPPPKRRKRLKFVLIFLAALLTLLLMIGGWIWANRYDLLERQAITYLDSLGIDADLDIRFANGTDADIRNIRLAYDGEAFLTVKRLQAAYQWRDLLGGVVERLDFEGLNATITVDETGEIVDGWRPPASGGETAFPIRGIGVRRAELTLNTPYGSVELTGSGEISAPDQFSITGNVEKAALSRDNLSIDLAGPLSLSRDGDRPFSVGATDMVLSLAHPSAALESTRVTLDAQYDPSSQSLTGAAGLKGGTFQSDLDIDGRINQATITGEYQPDTVEASVTLQLNEVALTNPERRDELARTLSLSDVLRDIPIAQNFAPTLTGPVEDLLTRSGLEAAFNVSLHSGVREITLTSPLTIDAQTSRARLSPIQDEPFYRYTTGAETYQISTLLDLNRPVPLTFDPMQIRILTDNGVNVRGIRSASGRLSTQKKWAAKTQGGRPADLAPFSIEFDYQRPSEDVSSLIMVGQARYDGDIPGGYVNGLKTGGTLRADLNSGDIRVGFTPNQRLRISRLETASDWIVTDMDGQLASAPRLYERRGENAPAITATLKTTNLIAIRPAKENIEEARVNLTVSSANLSGRLETNQQNWTVGFETLGLTSETFPVANMDLRLPSGRMDLTLSPDARTQFALSAPGSVLTTDSYIVRDMVLEAEGTAEDYTLDYSDGRVRLIEQEDGAISLPAFPVSGALRFGNGSFSGTAQTVFPRAPRTPIDIEYSFSDSGGSADISIERLMFQPDGLQPQDLAPALRGKIAQVRGPIDAKLRINFGGDEPLSGKGTVTLNDLSLGTAPGPVRGLSGTVELTSLFPVITAPGQRLSIESFNPGYLLEDGTLIYALIPDGVRVERATFPLGEGSISFDPFLWTYGAPENRVILRVSGVDVGKFLEGTADGRLKMTGMLEGTIPVVVRGIDVLVEGGRLEVKDGGIIQYQGKDLADAIPNEYASTAIEALRNFEYDSLYLEIDGPLDGEVELGVAFTGSNPDVFYNVPFQFDVSVEGELFNIARSFDPNALQQRALSVISGGGD